MQHEVNQVANLLRVYRTWTNLQLKEFVGVHPAFDHSSKHEDLGAVDGQPVGGAARRNFALHGWNEPLVDAWNRIETGLSSEGSRVPTPL